jgi:hypothetical protein
MSKFHLSIFILSSFLIINAFLSSTILEKYGTISSMNGKVIFNSKEFLGGEKMHFKITAYKDCESPLYYEYYSKINDINLESTSLPPYWKSSKAYETESYKDIITSSTNYYTLEKKVDENKSNGDYLLLVVDCGNGKVDFENTEKDESVKVIIMIVVGVILVIGIICFCHKLSKTKWLSFMFNQPYIFINGIYPNPNGQIYRPQGYPIGGYQEMQMINNNNNQIIFPSNNSPNEQYYGIPTINMNEPKPAVNNNPAPTPSFNNNNMLEINNTQN